MRSDTGWIHTYTGKRFWPFDPRPSEVCIEDIAHALSHLCRYAGHTSRFYSVAQHSVHVARYCSVDHQLQGLLHDAAEAYLVDIPSPVKRQPEMQGYRQAEARLSQCIATHFKIDAELPSDVLDVDRRILANEQRDLMPSLLDAVAPGVREPLPLLRIIPWSSEKAKQMFLNLYDQLHYERTEDVTDDS
jgi:hypothetical protein